MDYHTIATPQSHQTDMGSNSNEEAHHALTIWEVNKDRLSSMHQKVSEQTNHSKPCCRMELVLHFQNSSKPDQNQRKILSTPHRLHWPLPPWRASPPNDPAAKMVILRLASISDQNLTEEIKY